MKKHSQNLIWIDLEMTGLDTIEDRIIEIATIVTDKELRRKMGIKARKKAEKKYSQNYWSKSYYRRNIRSTQSFEQKMH